jgi:transcriptional regulator GlxA family with amidase domain
LFSPSLQYVQIIDHASSIGTLLHDMAETGICRGGQGEWRAYGLFYMLVDLLRSSRTVDDSTRILKVDKPGAALSVADEAQAYLRRNIHRRVALEELAAHCGCSLSSITHEYRRQTGESPLITHMRLRIDVAKMLVQQGYSLETIAAQTGFCDAYHLAKTFKRFVGISSRQYACAARPPEPGCARQEELV